uniref:Uncharacterized protein n=1 Tax=Glossina palpalis gambiensis TaxID=67801 RepID=A0A1B0ARW0_9MUSC
MVRLRFFPSFHVDSVITFNCERVFQRNPELFVSYVIDILKLCRATFVLVARFELHRKIKPFNVCKIHIRLRETLPALYEHFYKIPSDNVDTTAITTTITLCCSSFDCIGAKNWLIVLFDQNSSTWNNRIVTCLH